VGEHEQVLGEPAKDVGKCQQAVGERRQALGEVKALKEDQHRLWEEVRELRREVRGVKTTVERVTLSLEEEARSFTAWRLKEALGVEVVLDRVFDALEINVYGVAGDLCVVGEATVRLGLGLVEELLEKVEVLSSSIAYSGTSTVVKRYC
jgi:hypothetical protein